jgi:DNA-binding NarL/FixJ family response regulator
LPPTRVLVADLPRLQREIVIGLLREETDVEVVEMPAEPREASAEAARSRADVLILGHDDPRGVGRILERLPRLVVLTLADGDLLAWRYGLNPYRERLGELSPAALNAAIRRRATMPAWWTG